MQTPKDTRVRVGASPTLTEALVLQETFQTSEATRTIHFNREASGLLGASGLREDGDTEAEAEGTPKTVKTTLAVQEKKQGKQTIHEGDHTKDPGQCLFQEGS